MNASSALIIGAFLLASFQLCNHVFGASSTSTITVCANVLPWLKIRAYQHDVQYQVTENDLKQGYVDLPGSATIHIKTNANKSIGVRVSNEGPEKILVRESGAYHFSGADGTLIIAQPQRGTKITKNLDFRLILPKGAKGGTYSLNVAINSYMY